VGSLAQPIVTAYKVSLEGQVQAWYSLDPNMINSIAPFYPEINLNSVRFATGINTKHGAAITFAYKIYFPRALNFNDANDLFWIFHEIEHSVQYKRRGGEPAFLAEYVAKAAGRIISTGSFNVHDIIDLEQAADAKAQQVLGFYQNVGGLHPPPPFTQRCETFRGWCWVQPGGAVGAPCGCFGDAGQLIP
jgi:hypothetical protein